MTDRGFSIANRVLLTGRISSKSNEKGFPGSKKGLLAMEKCWLVMKLVLFVGKVPFSTGKECSSATDQVWWNGKNWSRVKDHLAGLMVAAQFFL